MLGEAADQRQPLGADRDQAFRQGVDMNCSHSHKLPADTIVLRRMLHDQRRKGAKLAR